MSKLQDVIELFRLPKVSVDLMLRKTEGNAPFYADLTREFYAMARRRHRRFPLIGQMTHGVALCDLKEGDKDYLSRIEAAGRRNYKKALRLGFGFTKIDFNASRAGIQSILRSADCRQGEMPAHMFEEDLPECKDPPSLDATHGYEYYGIERGDELAAFAGCFVAGEAFMIEQIYGHADHLSDGVVPMLLVEMALQSVAKHPDVRYYIYGTFFGATPGMRRFKKKFCFEPHRVVWEVG